MVGNGGAWFGGRRPIHVRSPMASPTAGEHLPGRHRRTARERGCLPKTMEASFCFVSSAYEHTGRFKNARECGVVKP